MQKQCINCKFSRAKPTKNCACAVSVTRQLLDAEPMKYNDSGFSYCDAFKVLYKGGKK